ncbi:PH domain-containing protein [[Haemophilus] felis]|uniref:YdbS-like PH domain-containing protein n=1 Tax=[Haemophilus] felis TaxID=123822 RepID=A0A1T0BA83_9PAST|nr:PH domain-containing protein [[Haemophilus] felis]OOS06964.1 hypothetical protein B0188_01645 [[Haemophilus] felis]
MGYVQNNLLKDETIIHQAQVSWWSQLTRIIIGILLLPIGIGILFLIAAFINVKTTELALTDKRIIAKFGFIRRDTVELRLEKIESIGVHQGFLGRMLGFGSVIVRGTGGTGAPIPFISNPIEFRSRVDHHLDPLGK